MKSFLGRIFSISKIWGSKPKDLSFTVNVRGAEITVNSTDIHLVKQDLANGCERRARRYRRYNRLMRHKKIWAVLNYVKSIDAIYNANNFFDLDQALLDYHNAIARFDESDFHPTNNDILCAFRFCDIQNLKGKCEHRLTEAEKHSISNWSTFTLNYTNILNTISNRFITYWEEALGSYKNKKAYLNRLDYLIEHLDDVRHREGLRTVPQLEDYLNWLQKHYINLKSKQTNGSIHE